MDSVTKQSYVKLLTTENDHYDSGRAHFADKYCSEDSKLLTTQTTYKDAAAFIFVVFIAARHNLMLIIK
jgi:hypothetical protein